MGIRFYCPNGHRLNVKDFLAGKRGICPHCEARFRIPRESEIPKGSPKVKPGSAAESAAPARRRRSKGGTALKATAREKPTTTARSKSELKPQPAARDPIDEAPDAVWYVRPPSGGQYGPAKGDVVRRWIAEGRVSVDTLVWREGWPDWQLAGPLFPSLGGAAETSSPGESVARQLQLVAARDAVSSPILPGSQKVAAKKKSITAVVVLIVLIVMLFAGLVAVLATKS